MTIKYYCDEEGCLATYPCSFHPDTSVQETLPMESFQPVVKTTELPIRVITVIPLPCGHNYPEPDKEKKFLAECILCDSIFHIEIKPDVCEITRIK